MRNVRVWISSCLLLAAVGVAVALRADEHAMAPMAPKATKAHAAAKAPKGPPTDAELIASAMKAAPMAIAKDASVVAMGADGKMRTLRAGTNGWTCIPDNPETPGPDPMCCDANAMEWLHEQIWLRPGATLAPWWRSAMQEYRQE